MDDKGCYGKRCYECELQYAKPGTPERAECKRRGAIALGILNEDEAY